MTITIETSGIHEAEQIIKLLESLHVKDYKIEYISIRKSPSFTKGDKTLDPRPLFGIWKDSPRTIDQIRAAAWKRN